MNITYNNITIPFYGKHLLDLIETSPYKDRAKRDVALDENGIPKTIVASLSGGCDSAAALYLTAKHFHNVDIYPLTFRDVHAPKDADAAAEIVEFIKNKFPFANIRKHTIIDFDDKDPIHYEKAQRFIDTRPEYKTLNLQQMSKCNQIDDGSDEFMASLDRPLRLDGMSANPPMKVRKKFSNYAMRKFPNIKFDEKNIIRIRGEARRDVENEPELKYNVYKPWVNQSKRFIASIYKEEGLLYDLYPITRSCVGGPNQTNNFTEWCWQCFWCYEKAWAFDPYLNYSDNLR